MGVTVNCIFEDFFVILKPKLPHELLSGVKTCVTYERKQKVKKGHPCLCLSPGQHRPCSSRGKRCQSGPEREICLMFEGIGCGGSCVGDWWWC
jgi:hypothetical protein